MENQHDPFIENQNYEESKEDDFEINNSPKVEIPFPPSPPKKQKLTRTDMMINKV